MCFTKLTKRFPIEDKKTATAHLISQEALYKLINRKYINECIQFIQIQTERRWIDKMNTCMAI
jgi:hypothetical protein